MRVHLAPVGCGQPVTKCTCGSAPIRADRWLSDRYASYQPYSRPYSQPYSQPYSTPYP